MGKIRIQPLGENDKIKLIDLNVNNHEKKEKLETVNSSEIEKVMDKVEAEEKQAWVFPEPKKDSKVRAIALRSARRERLIVSEVDRLSQELIRIEEELNQSSKLDEDKHKKHEEFINAKIEELQDALEKESVDLKNEINKDVDKKLLSIKVPEKIVEVHKQIEHVLDKRLIYFNISLILLLILTLIFK